jgi:large subunit ribosomal protein L9
MDVVLLERVEHLGQMGDVVTVKDGFARNFLLPQKKALRATKENISYFESRRAQLEATNLKRRSEAEAVGVKLDGQSFICVRQASETGHLYGSVSARDIAETLTENGFTVERNQVAMDRPLKELGLHPVRVRLHPEYSVTVTFNIARSQEEAERQARGENVLVRDEEKAAREEALANAEEFFEHPEDAHRSEGTASGENGAASGESAQETSGKS